MATATLGIVPESLRKSQRPSHGHLAAVLEAAEREHRAGHLHNALAAYTEAMGQWLRLSWIDRSGKVNTTVTDGRALSEKLRSGGHVDKWTFALINQTLAPPPEVTYRSVDIIAGIVRAVCSDRADCSVLGQTEALA